MKFVLICSHDTVSPYDVSFAHMIDKYFCFQDVTTQETRLNIRLNNRGVLVDNRFLIYILDFDGLLSIFFTCSKMLKECFSRLLFRTWGIILPIIACLFELVDDL